jgi:hypothetical protein
MQILVPCSIIIKTFMVEALPKLSNVSHAAFSGRWGSARRTVLELLATLYGCEFEREPFLVLWVWLSRVWADWRSVLIIVKPETVVAWHRSGSTQI